MCLSRADLPGSPSPNRLVIAEQRSARVHRQGLLQARVSQHHQIGPSTCLSTNSRGPQAELTLCSWVLGEWYHGLFRGLSTIWKYTRVVFGYNPLVKVRGLIQIS